MRKLLLISLLSLLLLPATVGAQVSNTISGGNASDYQPPTDNPQDKVGTGIQNTGTGLQPVPGQTNLSQENLSGSSDLQVLGTTSAPNPNTTSIPKPEELKNSLNPIPFVLIGLLTVAGAIYVAVQPSEKSRQKAVAAADIPEVLRPEPLPVAKSKKAKKKPGKKSGSKKHKK